MTLKKLIDKKDQMADWIIGDITHIIQTFEKRSPGSKGELQSCEYYAELCEEYGCDEVVVEEFEEHPNSFFGWLYFAVTFVLLSLGTYWFAPIIGAILCSLGALIALLQFGMYKKFMDRFFKKATGHNMMAIKKPKGEPSRNRRAKSNSASSTTAIVTRSGNGPSTITSAVWLSKPTQSSALAVCSIRLASQSPP